MNSGDKSPPDLARFDPRSNMPPTKAPSPQQPPQFQFSKEEMDFIRQERQRMFYQMQLPAVGGSVFGAYYLQKAGYWTKNPKLSYFPKCFVVGATTYVICSFVGAYQMMKKLKNIDGNFSHFIDDQMKACDDYAKDGAALPKDNFTNRIPSMSSIFKPQEETQQELPERPLTYDDLRRKNRLYPDQQSQGQTPTNRPPPPIRPPPQPISQPASSDGERTNQYGDAWTKD